jgi:outer membrane protein assembly factor BamA
MWPGVCTRHAVPSDPRGAPWRAVVVTLFCLINWSCTHAPQQRFSLDKLQVSGNSALEDDEIEEKIASRETPRFLGVIPGVIYEHETFNRFVLDRDLQRVERLYQSRGFYQARARAARVFREGNRVRVEIVVEEGPPVIVRRVDVHGLEGLPAEMRPGIVSAIDRDLKVGKRFEEEAFSDSEDAIKRALADRGYAQATVRRSADVNLPKQSASIGFWVEPGVPSEFGSVTIEGLGDLPRRPVRRALGIRRGEPYSESDLEEAKRALLDLGVFSSVSIEPQVDQAKPGESGKPRIPLLVKVERSKLRSVRLGGGVQLDTIKTDFHLTLGWESQNFFGGMRKFLVEAVPGAVLYPTRLPTFRAPERLLPQGRLRTEFRAPSFLERRLQAVIKGQVGIAPVLLAGRQDDDSPILGYRDFRFSAGLERPFRRLFGYLSGNLQTNVPFAYTGELNDALRSVTITYPALLVSLDLRDDPIRTREGVYLATELQVAGPIGDASDVRITPEVRGYVPISRKVTLAGRGAIGLLFAQNYGATVEPNALRGESGLSGDDATVLRNWVRDVQLMFFRGLFAGGAGSNRGYAAREIGPHGIVPYYIPGQASQDLSATCTPGQDTAAACKLPLGGFTLWEASVELRYPLIGDLSGTVFVDAADVSPREVQFRLRPHLSTGVGARYDTPVGPIRFDVGFRIPGLQAPKDAVDEATPAEILSLPLGISFGIGESY